MLLERMVWHEGKDWMIRRDGEEYSFREIDSDAWNCGVPIGMTIDDAALLFSGAVPVPASQPYNLLLNLSASRKRPLQG
jgi:hypothetical protein